MAKILGIVDYGVGNLKSVVNAVNYAGGEAKLISKADMLEECDSIILPGVGSFRKAMNLLADKGFIAPLREQVVEKKVPVLGICLGMQLLAHKSSEDGDTEGLGFIDCQVGRFGFDQQKYPELKIPHVGFNTINIKSESRIFSGLSDKADFYFTHSYRMQCANINFVSANCRHGEDFVAAIEQEHIAATQFHPEKSQANGLLVLKNFVEKF